MTSDILHWAGYHGTSIGDARDIEGSGFSQQGGGVYFAPLDNIAFAQMHGRRKAINRGDLAYAVILADFLGRRLESGLSGRQIVVPAEDIGKIIVREVLVFQLEPSRLLLPRNDYI